MKNKQKKTLAKPLFSKLMTFKFNPRTYAINTHPKHYRGVSRYGKSVNVLTTSGSYPNPNNSSVIYIINDYHFNEQNVNVITNVLCVADSDGKCIKVLNKEGLSIDFNNIQLADFDLYMIESRFRILPADFDAKALLVDHTLALKQFPYGRKMSPVTKLSSKYNSTRHRNGSVSITIPSEKMEKFNEFLSKL